MKSKIIKYYKITIKTLSIQCQCFALFLKNMMLLKSLHIKDVTLYDKIIINGNYVTLLWNVKGCHKIKVTGIATFSGNRHGIKFYYHKNNEPIEICFYGVFKKERKYISIKSTNISLPNKFFSTAQLPEIEYSVLNKINVISPWNNMKSEISESDIQVHIPDVSFQFDHFTDNNYNPLKTIKNEP
mgnify:CR=1 FL=1